MKSNTKSSITLPAHELDLVNHLMKILKAKSKVDIIRRGLNLLKESVDRAALRSSFRAASKATRASLHEVIDDMDHLSDEGL